MIQFNLLPDVKMQYIKTRRSNRLVFLTSFLVAGASLALLVTLFLSIAVFQKQHLNNLSKDISGKSDELRKVPDLDKALTVQNQLNSLDALHDQKPIASKFFTHINNITPINVTISAATLDFTKNTMSLTGNAKDISLINKFVDMLKFANLEVTGDQPKKAFSKVVLASHSPGDPESNTTASFLVSLEFEAVIFDGTKDAKITVPNQTSTRSETEKPTLFLKESPNSTESGQ